MLTKNQPVMPSLSPEAMKKLLANQAKDKAYEAALPMAQNLVLELIRANKLGDIDQAADALALAVSLLAPVIEKRLFESGLASLNATFEAQTVAAEGK